MEVAKPDTTYKTATEYDQERHFWDTRSQTVQLPSKGPAHLRG